MIRLAEYLFRWSGDAKYADYIERNIYNGILAQQNPKTGMVSYFLPLQAGSRKIWGSPTYDFWCCHGTLVQAHTLYNSIIYYNKGNEIAISQYIPSILKTEWKGTPVTIEQTMDHQASGAADDNSSAAGARHRPMAWSIRLQVSCERPVEGTINLRIPEWVRGEVKLAVNGEPVTVQERAPGFVPIARQWSNDRIDLELPKSLTAFPIADRPELAAFMDGPVVLAGLCAEERTLYGDPDALASLLTPDNEREWGHWLSGYRTKNQPVAIRFMPLNEVIDERYTVYFPVERHP